MLHNLKQALNNNPAALNFFYEFPASVKKVILEWIQNAKVK
ncbi:YdeI/OmpD-associated family protein [Flavihumibacter sp. ZG627]